MILQAIANYLTKHGIPHKYCHIDPPYIDIKTGQYLTIIHQEKTTPEKITISRLTDFGNTTIHIADPQLFQKIQKVLQQYEHHPKSDPDLLPKILKILT
jgi:hypothetical protein